MKIYCVKEKKKTDNVPGTEQRVVTKNNRHMMKAQCACCGRMKSTFVSSKN